jgi:hypothetical protein
MPDYVTILGTPHLVCGMLVKDFQRWFNILILGLIKFWYFGIPNSPTKTYKLKIAPVYYWWWMAAVPWTKIWKVRSLWKFGIWKIFFNWRSVYLRIYFFILYSPVKHILHHISFFKNTLKRSPTGKEERMGFGPPNNFYAAPPMMNAFSQNHQNGEPPSLP